VVNKEGTKFNFSMVYLGVGGFFNKLQTQPLAEYIYPWHPHWPM